jgi:DNA-binding GntR family transcriptional regulator
VTTATLTQTDETTVIHSDLTQRSRFGIVQAVLELITMGELRPGTETSERVLGQKLGLGGRAPVLREALALLSRDGIVESLPQRGYLIRTFSVPEAEEIAALRGASERVIVNRLNSLNLTDRLSLAEQTFSSLKAELARDHFATFAKLDGQLRCEWARLGGFITSVYSIGAWSDQLRVFYVSHPLTRAVAKEICRLHGSLLEAIKTRNGAAVNVVDALTNVVQQHIQGLEINEKSQMVGQRAKAASVSSTGGRVKQSTSERTQPKRSVRSIGTYGTSTTKSGRVHAKVAVAGARKK